MNAQLKREYKIFRIYPLRNIEIYWYTEIIMKLKEGQRLFFHAIFTKYVTKRILIIFTVNTEK